MTNKRIAKYILQVRTRRQCGVYQGLAEYIRNMENFDNRDTSAIFNYLYQLVENGEVKLRIEIENGCVVYVAH